MKKYVYIALAGLCAMGLTACSDDESVSIRPTVTGTVTDEEGNEYPWVRIGNLDWMAADLKCGYPFYDDLSMDDPAVGEQAFETYGNLYTYEDAVYYAPEGWRLPTDKDWQALERALGMSAQEAGRQGWRGNCANLLKSKTLLNLSLNGGGTNTVGYGWLQWNYYKEYGYYWTSTADTRYPGECIFFRKINSSNNAVMRQSTRTDEAYYSVRYVRDASAAGDVAGGDEGNSPADDENDGQDNWDEDDLD